MNKKVAIAISGGVDSSVAAWLLREAGYEVCGVTMRLGIPAEAGEETAPGGSPAGVDAKIVCEMLDIPLHTLDVAADLEGLVIHPFLSAYLQGRTPNPCVECNRSLKFGTLLRRVRDLGCDLLATGHYARVDHASGGARLLKPRDLRKDQTYFLYSIDRKALGHVLFPLAPYRKEEVRELAAKAGMPGSERPESQDVCFLPGGDLASLLRRYGREEYRAGDIVTRQGKVLGRHRGLPFYTVGQRGGLGISHRVPLYVLALDVPGNRLIVGIKEEVRATGLRADSPNILVDAPPVRASAKIRYAHRAAPCTVAWEKDGITVRFDAPQEAVTPGQSVVIYDGDLVAGGGIIREAL
jgi:tRNA-specific 2-thiouridylase